MTKNGLKREMARCRKIHENGRLSAADHESVRTIVNRQVAGQIVRRLDIVEQMVSEKMKELIN
jgi:hypothetical protein